MESHSLAGLKQRYQTLFQRIQRACKNRGTNGSTNSSSRPEIQLIAVSKKQSIDQIYTLYELGQRDFGENYAQELELKAHELAKRGCSEIRWHFIGHLQTNKIKAILPYIFCIHTIDSEKLAIKLAKLWKARLEHEATESKPLPIFIEVNIDQEPNKSGIFPDAVNSLAATIHQMPELRLQGLMCIPSVDSDPRLSFQKLNNLKDSLGSLTQGKLSMGMSEDFEKAIQEGATHIRVGTALFGERI